MISSHRPHLAGLICAFALPALSVVAPAGAAEPATCMGKAVTVDLKDQPDTDFGPEDEGFSDEGMVIFGTNGDDQITGGAGNDVICGGKGHDTLRGLGGDDVLSAGDDADRVEGGAGDDLLLPGTGKATNSSSIKTTWIAGGPGADTVDFGDVNPGITLDLGITYEYVLQEGDPGYDEADKTAARTAAIQDGGGAGDLILDDTYAVGGTLAANRGIWTVKGSDHADTITGHPTLATTIQGRGGADTLGGGDGDDLIKGGKGGDTFKGRKGADVIKGGTGADAIKGGKGSDLVKGGKGSDLVKGSTGDDTVKGGKDADRVVGNKGDDTVKGGSGDDTVKGGKNADRLNGGAGSDICKGGSGQDVATRCETVKSAS